MLILFLFLVFTGTTGVASEQKQIPFNQWKTQVEEILQATHKWKNVMESAMAQFALAKFPDNFTPDTFSKGVNATIVLDQQKTTLRSLIYHRALSTMDEQLYVSLPGGVTVEAAHGVVDELRQQGFNSYWLTKPRLVFVQKTK